MIHLSYKNNTSLSKKNFFPLHWGYGGTFPSFAQADSYGCMGPNHGRCWSCLKHCLNEDRKKQMFCFQHEPLFRSVRSYGMCTQVSELLTVNVMVLFCGLHAKNADVWSVSPCWVLFKYETMHSKAVLMISKKQKCRQCSASGNTKTWVWCHHRVMVIKRAHDFVSVLKPLFSSSWFCPCWIKFLLIVV